VDKPRDLYSLLGVPRDATVARIKAAYRRLARRYHPDVGGGSAERFRALKDAFETLSNPEERARYDRALDMDRRPAAAAFPVAVSYHDTVWADGRESASGEILLSAAEAAAGGILPLEIPFRARCRECGGSGNAGSFWLCAACDGHGTRPIRVPIALRIPPGLRDGSIFQVRLDDPLPVSVMLAVHILKH
jgi:DnaJ-class molecular chaperone